MIENNIRSRSTNNTASLGNAATSDGQSINNKRTGNCWGVPADVMERKPTLGAAAGAKAQALTLPASAGAALTGVRDILQGLVGAAGQLAGAVANGLKAVVDAGAGLVGLIGNDVSQLLALLG